MSCGVTAAVIGGIGAIAGGAVAYQNGQQQKRAAERQGNMAREQEKAANEANNRANQRRADPSAILDEAMQSGRAGASGTMLTGTQGIDTSALNLGRNTLLGG